MSQRIDNRTKRREPTERTATFTAFGLAAEAKPLTPGLYVVATPIGNLQDVSFRALNVLAAADAVLAEDTRVTKTLLAHYGITTPLVSYHEHSNDAVRERMVHRIKEGQALALVSDAGTPLVSDPGYRLVQAAIEEGLARHPDPRPLRRAHRARRLGPADRPLLLRRLPAAEERRAPHAAGRDRRDPRHADAVRGPAPPARNAGGRRRRARRTAGRGGARAHQDVRDDPARSPCRNWRGNSPRKVRRRARSWC